MRELELILRALQAASLATPAIVSVIQAVKGGVSNDLTDDQILEHAARITEETRQITSEDMSDRP
jgi:hypothetical protein